MIPPQDKSPVAEPQEPVEDIAGGASLAALMDGKSPTESFDIGYQAATKAGQVRGEDGRFTKNETEKPPPGAPSSVKPGGDDENKGDLDASGEDGVKDDPETNEDMQIALAALKRDGLPQSVIDGMDKETILEYGAKRQKNQTDIDSYTQQFNDLKKSIQEPAKEENTDNPPKPAGAEQSSEESDPVNRLVTEFSETFGEDIGEHLEKAMKGFAEENRTLRDELEEVQLSIARDSLSGDFPQLKDSDNYDRVAKTMKSMNGDIKGTRERMEMASKIEFAVEMAEAAAKAVRKAHAQRDDGVPEPKAPTRPSGDSTMTAEDLRDASLDAREKGDIRLAGEYEARLQQMGQF